MFEEWDDTLARCTAASDRFLLEHIISKRNFLLRDQAGPREAPVQPFDLSSPLAVIAISAEPSNDMHLHSDGDTEEEDEVEELLLAASAEESDNAMADEEFDAGASSHGQSSPVRRSVSPVMILFLRPTTHQTLSAASSVDLAGLRRLCRSGAAVV